VPPGSGRLVWRVVALSGAGTHDQEKDSRKQNREPPCAVGMRRKGRCAYPEPGVDHCDGKLQKMENTSRHSRIVRTKLLARTHIDREPTLGVRATGKQQTHTRG
jgi:hypothetical protein